LNPSGESTRGRAMSTLSSSIQSLADAFATKVLAAIRGASLEEILGQAGPARRGPGRPRGSASSASRRIAKGRRVRRSASDIKAVADRIVTFVAKHNKGVRGEQIRKELGIAKNAWMKPLGMALASKKLRKTGKKRATTYFASK
jgi:hypothetical protein